MGWHRSLSLILSVFLLLLVISSKSILGATHYVSYEGENVPPYASWATATFRVSLAAQYCQPGDTIRVATGTFFDPQTIVLNGGLTLIGSGMDSTSLSNPAGLQPHINVDSGNFTVLDLEFTSQFREPWPTAIIYYGPSDTLTIKGCRFEDYQDASASIAGYLDISDCEFINCPPSSSGHVIWVDWGSGDGRITDNLFVSYHDSYSSANSIHIDWPWQGGRFHISNNVFSGYQVAVSSIISPDVITIENNLFINNFLHPTPTSPNPVEAPYIQSITSFVEIRNNFFEGNYDEESLDEFGFPCVEILMVGNTQIYNNVFVGKQAAVRVRPHITEVVPFTYQVDHNLFWLNSAVPKIVLRDKDFRPYDSLFCEDFFHQTDTSVAVVEYNLCRDPMFVDTIDYLLQAGSPCIDAGRPTVLDLDGTRSDIAPFGGSAGQFYSYQDFPPLAPDGFNGAAISNIASLQWFKNSESDLRHYILFKTTDAGNITDSTHVLAYIFQVGDSLLKSTASDSSLLGYQDSSFSASVGARYVLVAVDSSGLVSDPSAEVHFIGTDANQSSDLPVPQSPSLEQNYPNPFNAETAIIYNLPNIGARSKQVTLVVYNSLGQEVRTLVDQDQYSGRHTAFWDGKDRFGEEVASGIYFYTLKMWGTDFVNSKKMILIK